MKINIKDLKTIAGLLEKVTYLPKNESAKIFFEIDCGKVVDDGTFIMEVKDNKQTALSARPGLVLTLEKEGERKVRTSVELCYAVINYSPKFSLESYMDILGIKFNQKQKAALIGLDCYLVKNEYIYSTFKL